MMAAPLTRRAVFGLGALLGPLLRSGAAMPSDPLLAAIRITEAVDLAYRAAGLASSAHMVAGKLSAEWRAHREKLVEARYVARANLHALTPVTMAGARALIAYYAARAERAGTAGAARSARRRLREVFARSGAYALDRASWGSLAASEPAPEVDPVSRPSPTPRRPTRRSQPPCAASMRTTPCGWAEPTRCRTQARTP